MAARFTPSAPDTPPANVPSRLPLTSTRVDEPPRPRSDAVWLPNVVEPIMLPSETLPALLLAEMRFSSSMALTAPVFCDLLARDHLHRQRAFALDALDVRAGDVHPDVLGGNARSAQRGDHRRHARGDLEVLSAHLQSIHGNSPSKSCG